MNLYLFSSSTLTNVWAGVGAHKWAVSEAQAAMTGAATKAAKMPIGSLGLLYCVETKSFTTPFIVMSRPEQGTIEHVWPEPWRLPFDIHPLGSPTRQMSIADIKALPCVENSTKRWNQIFTVQGQFAFQAITIGEEDWAAICEQLVVRLG